MTVDAHDAAQAAALKKLRLGELLVQRKLISQGQLDQALAEQKTSNRRLGRILVDNGFIQEDVLLNILSGQIKIPYIHLSSYPLVPEIVMRLPEAVAKRHRAIVIEETEQDILVGMADPTDIFAYDEISRLVKKSLRLALVHENELLHILELVYQHNEEIRAFASELGQELKESVFELEALAKVSNQADIPVIKLVQSVFSDAVAVRASDIHIEPDEEVLRIRRRVDGVLQEQVMNEKHIIGAVVSRLKLMAGLDIAEKRLPLDGRFNFKVKDKILDVRVSTMPTQHGESVVMRLLERTAGLIPLERTGMPPGLVKRFRALVREPHGLLLVTGPTGSGKTTTLYAALNEINSPKRKIITVEDPVEYRLPRITQVQVNSRIGLDYARVLRSILRQDSDIVLIGEMRDRETAEIGIRAAMTGQLVLSTLHTNDAVSSATRLIDMGVDSYLVAATLRGVLAQRLLRRNCDKCVIDVKPDANQTAWLRHVLGPDQVSASLKRGRGCTYCSQTGFRGRIGVYELLVIDAPMAESLRLKDYSAFAQAAHAQASYRPLVRNALDFTLAGTTTVDEAMELAGAWHEDL